jgi:hypothetical protein
MQVKQLTAAAIGIVDENDASRERSAEVTTATESAVACCRELCSERQKAARQLSLHHFFKRVEICQSTGPARRPVQPHHAA